MRTDLSRLPRGALPAGVIARRDDRGQRSAAQLNRSLSPAFVGPLRSGHIGSLPFRVQIGPRGHARRLRPDRAAERGRRCVSMEREACRSVALAPSTAASAASATPFFARPRLVHRQGPSCNSAPFNASMAASAPSDISTNPKPRERPVSRSVTTEADVTVPCALNACRKSSSCVSERQVSNVQSLAHDHLVENTPLHYVSLWPVGPSGRRYPDSSIPEAARDDSEQKDQEGRGGGPARASIVFRRGRHLPDHNEKFTENNADKANPFSKNSKKVGRRWRKPAVGENLESQEPGVVTTPKAG